MKLHSGLRLLIVATLASNVLGDAGVVPAVPQVPLLVQNQSSPKRVAIIGAGAAGTSTAYHLRRYAAAAQIAVNITVFERNDYIGGRSTTVYAFENEDTRNRHGPRVPVELGASIFVSVNHILVNATRALNLSTNSNSDPAAGDTEREVLGVWDGNRFVLIQQMGGSRWQSWWSTIKLLWRYGMSPYRTVQLMKGVVGDFLKLYEEPFFPWREGLTEVAAEADLLDVTTSTGREFLRRNNISDSFSVDIVQASTRVNYAQNLGVIHGLETMVCMATDGAMAVEGGNWQIFAGMLNASGAKFIPNTHVDKLERLQNTQEYRIGAKSSELEDRSQWKFDAVVLAAPFHQSKIEFEPAPSHVPDNIEYVSLHVTLFSSPHRLSPAAFNLSHGQAVPDVVLTTLSPEEQDKLERLPGGVGSAGFFSISKLRSATNHYVDPPRKEFIYKIFSPAPVNATFLHHLLGLGVPEDGTSEDKAQIPWIYRKTWLSYPYLPPRVTFEPQKLHDGIWYTGGIESFISTMETSSLSGMNVAKLIVESWA